MKEVPEIPAVPPSGLDASILICTYNRAAYLADTLDSVAAVDPPAGASWDVLVVDNNSSDDTRAVVESRIPGYPVPLRYLFEGTQGKSNALNTGIRSTPARIIVFTDDDVRVPKGWLEAAVRPLIHRHDLQYTGGPVQAIWGAPSPPWLDERGNLGGTIAVKNHGTEPFVFEDRLRTPLGVNMAVRRSLIEQIGGFRPELGRNGEALLGQEQAEFFYRSRGAGARGLYVPAMALEHVVPASRLTRSYFRRWWYWKGVSHARVHRMHSRTELGLDLSTVPRVFGVPRFLFSDAVTHVVGWLRALVTRAPHRRAEHLLMLAYTLGYVRECRTSVPDTACPLPMPQKSLPI